MSSSDSPIPTRPSYDPYDPWEDEEAPKTPEKTRVACVEVPGAPKKLTTKEERARYIDLLLDSFLSSVLCWNYDF